MCHQLSSIERIYFFQFRRICVSKCQVHFSPGRSQSGTVQNQFWAAASMPKGGKRASTKASSKAGPPEKKPKISDENLSTTVPAPMPMDVVLGKEQAAHIVRVHESLQIIYACPFFDGIAERNPLKV